MPLADDRRRSDSLNLDAILADHAGPWLHGGQGSGAAGGFSTKRKPMDFPSGDQCQRTDHPVQMAQLLRCRCLLESRRRCCPAASAAICHRRGAIREEGQLLAVGRPVGVGRGARPGRQLVALDRSVGRKIVPGLAAIRDLRRRQVESREPWAPLNSPRHGRAVGRNGRGAWRLGPVPSVSIRSAAIRESAARLVGWA